LAAQIGKLDPVPLRELWKHEERGFSAWLAEHLDLLAEAVGITLSEPLREVEVGSFSVDLVAEDEGSNRVVIENQLEPTDHDHLGKLLTYLTNLEAKTAIWVARDPRPEHINAITWLNETTPDDVSFFLVKIAAYRIGNSDPAPLFTVVVGPSAEGKDIGRSKKELAERHVLRLKFWEGLLARAKARGLTYHAGRSPSKDSWISASAGKRGLTFVYLVWLEDKTGVELYIDTGDGEENKAIFDALAAKQADIEKAFGGSLSWERLDGKRGSRIRHTIQTGGISGTEERWPIMWDEMTDAMERLARALKPYIGGGA
jgi:hypothetical protein